MILENEIKAQLGKVKKECYELSKLVNDNYIHIEYDKNKKINDEGKLKYMPIKYCITS